MSLEDSENKLYKMKRCEAKETDQHKNCLLHMYEAEFRSLRYMYWAYDGGVQSEKILGIHWPVRQAPQQAWEAAKNLVWNKNNLENVQRVCTCSYKAYCSTYITSILRTPAHMRHPYK